MGNKDILAQLIMLDENSMAAAIDAAFVEYAQFIADIYNDIYDSCIELYYSTYDPIKYDRHGYPEGKNLYQAADIFSDEFDIETSIMSSSLWPYYAGKRGGDKRSSVLTNVMTGLRGTKSRKTPPGWPKPWYAKYPNEFSKFSIWKSSGTTLDAILYEWAKNGVNDTTDVFFKYLKNNL